MNNNINKLISYGSQFTLMSMGYEGTLMITDFVLKTLSVKYKGLSSNNQKYVTTNLNKSLVMLYIFASFCKIFKQNPQYVLNTSCVVDKQSQDSWKFLTMLYACTDFVGLIKSSKMPFSTQLHHYGVILALFIVICSNFNGASLSKSLVIYGAFSSSAGIVNTYLGARKLYNADSNTIKFLKNAGLISYILACSSNWTWQLRYLMTYFNNTPNKMVILKFLLNTGLLYSWIQDDLKLMRHLATN